MLVDKINEFLNKYAPTSSMYVFCAYIKSNIHIINRLTIEDVAKKCYTSKGQISKCVKNLGYNSYLEFRDACLDYSKQINEKTTIFSKENDLPDNIKLFSTNIIKMIDYISTNLNNSLLNKLVNDILQSNVIYLYAQGDNRIICNYIQTKFSSLFIPVVICDIDFENTYFSQGKLLIVISTNGTIFRLDKKLISKIKKLNIKTWLITCNDDISINFFDEKLIVPSLENKYNEYSIKYIIDIILASVHLMRGKY